IDFLVPDNWYFLLLAQTAELPHFQDGARLLTFPLADPGHRDFQGSYFRVGNAIALLLTRSELHVEAADQGPNLAVGRQLAGFRLGNFATDEENLPIVLGRHFLLVDGGDSAFRNREQRLRAGGHGRRRLPVVLRPGSGDEGRLGR